VIETSLTMGERLAHYASPRARMTRLLKNGDLIRVRRGLYVEDRSVSRLVLAPLIYGPSYVSFQSALAMHGLIPEQVAVVTSASYAKNRDRTFRTPLGEFCYWYLPPAVYPYGLHLEDDVAGHYLLASPEKALCDLLYKTPEVTTQARMEALLLADWRIEREALRALDRDFVQWLAPRYRRRSVRAFSRWLAGEAAR